MTILDALKQMRDDLKLWCTNNFESQKTRMDDGDADTLATANTNIEAQINFLKQDMGVDYPEQGYAVVQEATRATKDNVGNTITDTYALKTEVQTVQDQLDAKQSTITGGASTITTSNLAVSRALVSNSSGKVVVSEITSTELGRLSGVTSNIQTQLDGKLNNKTADQMRTYINAVGKNVEGETFNIYNVDTGLYDKEVVAATGAEIFNLYDNIDNEATIATGMYSHAEGYNTKAYGDYSHAECENTTAEGACSHAEGILTSAIGNYSHAEGYITKAIGDCSHAAGFNTTADNYQYVVGKYNATRTAPTEAGQDTSYEDGIFIVGNGVASDDASRSNALRVSSGGRCYSGRFVAGTADFAELFEWSDGNPEGEDRRGLFVALDGEQIKLASADDDYFGVISGTPAFIGNSASEEWHDKYLTDVFGTRLSQEVEIPEKIDEETGEVLVPAHTVTRFIINPEYNPNETYVMRENRKEWDTVGLCGQVVVVDDGTCIAGGYCKPSHNGIGTAADSGYRVMKRIDETHIKVLVK